MPIARIVLASGAIDGTNTVFSTGGFPYVPGSTAYILNGRIHSQSIAGGADYDYGFTESNPGAGEITVDNAPLVGDVVQIFFWDTAPYVEIVGTLTAHIKPEQRLVGKIEEIQIRAMLRPY